jgi:hypothetical protein
MGKERYAQAAVPGRKKQRREGKGREGKEIREAKKLGRFSNEPTNEILRKKAFSREGAARAGRDGVRDRKAAAAFNSESSCAIVRK